MMPPHVTWWLTVLVTAVLLGGAAQACPIAGACAAPTATCAAPLDAVGWYDCGKILWAKGFAAGRSAADPVVDPTFTACNAHGAERSCAQVLDLCPDGPQPTEGVLLPGGFDMRLLDPTAAAAVGASVSPVVSETLRSYAGKTGADAVAAVCARPLELTTAEAKLLYGNLTVLRAEQIEFAYDARRHVDTVPFANMSRCFRTAIVDVFWTRTLPPRTSSLAFDTVPTSPTQLWAAALAGDMLALTQGIYALTRSDPSEAQRYQRLGRALEICRQSCDVDMILTIDESKSVKKPAFLLSLEAAASIVGGFDDLSQNGTRVGVALFAGGYRLAWNLSTYNTSSEYTNAILGIKYGNVYGTNTGLAVNRSAMDLLADVRPDAALIPRGLVVITDGSSQDKVNKAAKTARAAGITTFGVGVARYKEAQIAAIAGDPSRMFLADTFEDLLVLAEAIGGAQCLASATITSNSTVTVSKGQVRYLEVPVPVCDYLSSVAVTFKVLRGNATVYFSLKGPAPNAGNADGRLDVATGDVRTFTLTANHGETKAYLGLVSYSETVLRITVEDCPATPTVPPTLTEPATVSPLVSPSKSLVTTMTVTSTVSTLATVSRSISGLSRTASGVGNTSSMSASRTHTSSVPVTSSETQALSTTMSRTVSTSATATGVVTATLSLRPSGTRTTPPSASPSVTQSATATWSLLSTVSRSIVATTSSTLSSSPPLTSTPAQSASVSKRGTVSAEPSSTPSAARTASPDETPTATPRATSTPSMTVQPPPTPTATVTPSVGPTPTVTSSSTPTASATYHPPYYPPPPPFFATPLGRAVIAGAAALLLCCCLALWGTVALYRRSRWGHDLDELKGDRRRGWRISGEVSRFHEREGDLLGVASLNAWDCGDPTKIRRARDEEGEELQATSRRPKLTEPFIVSAQGTTVALPADFVLGQTPSRLTASTNPPTSKQKRSRRARHSISPRRDDDGCDDVEADVTHDPVSVAEDALPIPYVEDPLDDPLI